MFDESVVRKRKRDDVFAWAHTLNVTHEVVVYGETHFQCDASKAVFFQGLIKKARRYDDPRRPRFHATERLAVGARTSDREDEMRDLLRPLLAAEGKTFQVLGIDTPDPTKGFGDAYALKSLAARHQSLYLSFKNVIALGSLTTAHGHVFLGAKHAASESDVPSIVVPTTCKRIKDDLATQQQSAYSVRIYTESEVDTNASVSGLKDASDGLPFYVELGAGDSFKKFFDAVMYLPADAKAVEGALFLEELPLTVLRTMHPRLF